MNRDLRGLMKLTTPFTILNKKFNEMDLIRKAMKHEEFWDKECREHPTNNRCRVYCG